MSIPQPIRNMILAADPELDRLTPQLSKGLKGDVSDKRQIDPEQISSSLTHLKLTTDRLNELKECQALRQLVLAFEGKFKISHIKELAGLTSLRTLCLPTSNFLNDKAWSALEALPALTEISFANLGKIQGTFLKGVKNPERWRALNFATCVRLKSEHLIEHIAKFTQLNFLSLSKASLHWTPEQKQQVLEKVATLPALHELYLRHMSLTDDHLEMLKGLKTLKRLDVSENPDLSPEQIQSLKESLPRCTILSGALQDRT